MNAPLLSVRGVTAFYGHVMALKGVDMDYREPARSSRSSAPTAPANRP